MVMRTALAGNYGSSIWATEITVARQDDRLLISGQVPFSDLDLGSSQDLFLTYLKNRESSDKRARNESAHLQFANARNDEDLIDFVSQFGPVAASDVTQLSAGQAPEGLGFREIVKAVQDINELNREQSIYRMCLRLLGQLSRGERDSSLAVIRECTASIVPGVSEWLKDWNRECVSRTSKKQGPPFWRFLPENYESLLHFQVMAASEPCALGGYDPFKAGHEVLCGVLNAFPTRIEYLMDRPVETLSDGSLLYGIRPLLYLILRHEYMTQIGMEVCANSACSRFFVVERLRQKFCDETCSRRFRQRQYWSDKGSQLRAQRRMKRKTSEKDKE
jgi:hypothetical protein